MCGFLAFAGHQPDLALLDQLAAEAGRRGPDGSGWATLTARGWTVRHDPARSLPAHPRPPEVTHASVVVAHARLATDGGIDAASRVQPSRAGHDGVVAWNGALPGRWPNGDTAVLAASVDRYGPGHGIDRFLDLAGDLAAERLAVLAATPGQLWAGQRLGHYGPMPLHLARRPEGVYLCSRPFPGSAALHAPAPTLLHGGPARPWPVLVGISPVDDRPDRVAFDGTRSGARLARLMGAEPDQLLDVADTDNLFRWLPAGFDPPAADWRTAAARVHERWPGRVLVACGALVGRHLGATDTGFTATASGGLVVSIPHPSGRCRAWNDPATSGRVANVLDEARRRAAQHNALQERTA